MTARKGKGSRRKTRDKLSLNIRNHGKIRINSILENYNKGDRVVIKINPAYHDGMPNPRFLGSTGIVKSKRGECYEVMINNKGNEKILIVHPAHLKRV
ncbi:50S ribosomal protein L21e [Nanobdella aerobiophila]|uniref:Large ribosomal subunit protein eL21 n=1 Tax=Nanobdella aerobiophila TaxID=2586965 RepID=A0A915SS79_9ARCH|nr:50S ribosomal protein L21e [Nanobdella aerobiophila]BBL45216.1 50S ribosomal protein L21e [Nanobdella aerobiophila]